MKIFTVPSIDEFKEFLRDYSKKDTQNILKAAYYAENVHKNQKRASGEKYITHPLSVASILISMHLDAPSVMAALLHDVIEDSSINEETLSKTFDPLVVDLVKALTNMGKAEDHLYKEASNILYLLLSMTKDVRVILIKLADKLHNLYTLEYLPAPRQKRFAQEVKDIFAPLAEQLGIAWMSDKLHDLAISYLDPPLYKKIEVLINRESKGSTFDSIKKDLKKKLKDIPGIHIETRVKTIHSVYAKIFMLEKPVEAIYDLLGIRIICEKREDCYTILGIVHSLWTPLDGRFKDYIALPKSNQYQSIHTTVMESRGKILEIQIRTHDMHETAEHGVSAHWRYKNYRSDMPQNIALIQKMKALPSNLLEPIDSLEEIRQETLSDSISVFTPDGDIIELPFASTAIDFAYYIHTDIGNHALSARTDGQIINLSEPLKNTQVIEILTSPMVHPKSLWLKCVRTSRARQRIAHWINHFDPTTAVKGRFLFPLSNHQKNMKQEILEARLLNSSPCCNILYGTTIKAVLQDHQNLVIHSLNCPLLLNYDPHEILDVEWVGSAHIHNIHFRVLFKSQQGIYTSIEKIILSQHANLLEGKVRETGNGPYEGSFILSALRSTAFEDLRKAILMLPEVLSLSQAPTPRN